jgi:hypothetical protein
MGKFIAGVLVGGTVAYLGHKVWCKAADAVKDSVDDSTRLLQAEYDALKKSRDSKIS